MNLIRVLFFKFAYVKLYIVTLRGLGCITTIPVLIPTETTLFLTRSLL